MEIFSNEDESPIYSIIQDLASTVIKALTQYFMVSTYNFYMDTHISLPNMEDKSRVNFLTHGSAT